MAVYGYCRISRKKQNIQKQVRNILKEYPDAKLYQEAFTGTKFFGRKEFDKLLKKVKPQDLIVFDEVSRMSRDAEDGVEQYFELFDNGVDLVFLKEPYINTSVYRKTIEETIQSTGNEIADIYIEATNKVVRLLAKQQIIKAFEQAQKEVILKHNLAFGGSLTDKETWTLAGICKTTYYKYKKELEQELLAKEKEFL